MEAERTEDKCAIAALAQNMQERLLLAAQAKRQRLKEPDNGGATLAKRSRVSTPSSWETLWKQWDDANKVGRKSDELDRAILTRVREAKNGDNVAWDTSDGAPLRWAVHNNRQEDFSHILARVSGDTEVLRAVLQARNNEVLREASARGHLDIVNTLLSEWHEYVDPSANGSEALRRASAGGHYDIVELLLNDGRSISSERNSEALREASANGYGLIVCRLLGWNLARGPRGPQCNVAPEGGDIDDETIDEGQKVYPDAIGSEALRIASANGHGDVVDILLKDGRADPTARHGEALRRAIEGVHVAVVKRLLEDERVKPTDGDMHGYKPLWYARNVARRAKTIDMRKKASDIIGILFEHQDVKGDPDSIMNFADYIQDMRKWILDNATGPRVRLVTHIAQLIYVVLQIVYNILGFWPLAIAGGGVVAANAFTALKRWYRNRRLSANADESPTGEAADAKVFLNEHANGAFYNAEMHLRRMARDLGRREHAERSARLAERE